MKRPIRKVAVVLVMIVVLAATAFAFSTIFTFQGTVDNYDFGQYGGPQPGTVEIQAFTMKPGDVIPWHLHKGLSYVILVHGTLAEQEFDGTCRTPTLVEPGSAFVEPPGRVHRVSNPGPGSAIIYWATVFPQADGPAGDAVFVDQNCQ
jgi:quercetin dioxygenase-like cupin family protein